MKALTDFLSQLRLEKESMFSVRTGNTSDSHTREEIKDALLSPLGDIIDHFADSKRFKRMVISLNIDGQEVSSTIEKFDVYTNYTETEQQATPAQTSQEVETTVPTQPVSVDCPNTSPVPTPGIFTQAKLPHIVDTHNKKRTIGIQSDLLRLLMDKGSMPQNILLHRLAPCGKGYSRDQITRALWDAKCRKLVTVINGEFSLTDQGIEKAMWFIEHPARKMYLLPSNPPISATA